MNSLSFVAINFIRWNSTGVESHYVRIQLDFLCWCTVCQLVSRLFYVKWLMQSHLSRYSIIQQLKLWMSSDCEICRVQSVQVNIIQKKNSLYFLWVHLLNISIPKCFILRPELKILNSMNFDRHKCKCKSSEELPVHSGCWNCSSPRRTPMSLITKSALNRFLIQTKNKISKWIYMNNWHSAERWYPFLFIRL